MDEKMLQRLRDPGVDVDGACERFMGNTAMLYKFLLKFPNDKNYAELEEALCAGEIEKAFNAAHTLKGVCGNMSFVSLQCDIAEMTELLRAGKIEAARQKMPDVEKEYNKIVELIDKL